MMPRVQLHPTFRQHLTRKRSRGLTVHTLARLGGFTNDANFRSQLREPFAPTVQNRSRWQTVATLVNYSGDSLQEVAS